MNILTKNDISSTDYIEMAKGQYKSNVQRKNSIYFSEDDFILFELIFAKFNNKYRPFTYTNFDKNTAILIIQELLLFAEKVKINKSVISTLKEMGYDIYVLSNSAISKIDLIPNNELISVISELAKWLEETLQESNYFSVLGL